MERAIGGDFDAFSALVRASTPRQYAIATLILHDADRAQDAVQDALVSAWRGLSALRDPDAWDGWLHRLTVRACYRQVRNEQRRTLRELHATSDRDSSHAQDASMGLAERDRLERELSRLPIDQRVVIVLHFYIGLPLTEVADVLAIPAGTAKSRLHRGLHALRSTMVAEPDSPPSVFRERTT